MIARVFADILIVISIFFFPLWISLIFVITALFYFKNFYEAAAAGVLIDMFYGVPLAKFFHIQWITTLLFLFAYFAVNYIKRYTRFHESR